MKFIAALVKVTLSCFALVGGVLLVGLLMFSVAMAVMRAPLQPTQKTEAIVVLTGGSGRVEAGLKLYQENLGDYLLVSGVHKDVRIADILRLWPGPALQVGGLALDPRATSTAENAIYSIEWIRAKNIKSIRLITAYYHMPRAYLEFKRRMPDLQIVPHGIQPDTGPGYMQMLLGEYGKTILAFLPASPET